MGLEKEPHCGGRRDAHAAGEGPGIRRRATGNRSLDGKGDQANVGQVGDRTKDAVKDALD